MGLFSFIKGAGAKIFKKKEAAPAAAQLTEEKLATNFFFSATAYEGSDKTCCMFFSWAPEGSLF